MRSESAANRRDASRDDAGTLELLRRGRAGDATALDALFARHMPVLRRWAAGRLPQWARDIADTPDLVQDTMLDAFKRLEHFEYRGVGALQAYLRQALMNRIRNELRRSRRKPSPTALDDDLVVVETSPLDLALAAERLERYEHALLLLSDDERALVIARLELGLTWPEVAEATNRPSANAARMAVARALLRLAERIE
jgi:RNA polymerase sigma-70 factor (ECF subfamily)